MRHHFLATVLSTLVSATASGQPTAQEIARYPHREAENVYRTVLDAVFRSDAAPRAIVLYDSLSHPFAHIDTLNQGAFAFPPGFDVDAFRNFLRVTSLPYRLQGKTEFALEALPRFAYPVRLKRIKAKDLRGFSASRNRDTVLVMRDARDPILIEESPFWTAFRKRFPDAWGYTVLTRVGFNPQVTDAFVQIMHRCYAECTSVESLFLRKSGNRWVVENRVVHPEQTSEEFPPGALRYVGKGGSMRTVARHIADSTRQARVDSIAMEKIPRHIRGMVVDSQTGKGIDGLPIFSVSWPGVHKKIAVTKNGRFHLRPETGGILFVIQCPNLPFDEFRNLAGESFPVRQGLDTTLRITVESMVRCRAPRRIRPIQSGILASREYLQSTYPSDTEGAVFDAVIRTVFAPDSVPLFRSRSISRCHPSSFCTTGAWASLLRVEGLVDSSLIADFVDQSTKVEPINPAFASSRGLHLLTEDQEQFLLREGRIEAMDRPLDDATVLWSALNEVFPGMKGIAAFTRVGFDRAGSRALLTLRREMPGKSPHHETFLLTRTSGQWTVSHRDVERSPVMAGIVNDECVPMRGGRDLSSNEVKALSGRYRITLVGSDGAVHRVEHEVVAVPTNASMRQADFHLTVRDVSDGAISGTWLPLTAAYRRVIDGHRGEWVAGHFCGYKIR